VIPHGHRLCVQKYQARSTHRIIFFCPQPHYPSSLPVICGNFALLILRIELCRLMDLWHTVELVIRSTGIVYFSEHCQDITVGMVL
jgi:hypothetical protein